MDERSCLREARRAQKEIQWSGQKLLYKKTSMNKMAATMRKQKTPSSVSGRNLKHFTLVDAIAAQHWKEQNNNNLKRFRLQRKKDIIIDHYNITLQEKMMKKNKSRITINKILQMSYM